MAVYNISGTKINDDLPFNGEKMVTFGDSITWYDGHKQSGVTIKGYQSYLREIGLDVTNLGVDGAKIAYLSGGYTDICETVSATDCSGYDFCMVAGGTNDYGGATPRSIGEIASSDYDNTTVIGALQGIIEKIVGDNKKIKLFLCTPLQRTDVTGENSLGKTLKDYRDAIILTAEYYGIPVLDFYAMSGLDSVNMATLTADGVHPNNNGYKFLSNKLVTFVKGL